MHGAVLKSKSASRFWMAAGSCLLFLEISFIANQNDENGLISMTTWLFQPSGYVVKTLAFSYVINQHCVNNTPIIRTCNGSVSFLASSVPDLSLDTLASDDEGSSLELNPDCSLGIQTELVPSEPSLRLAHFSVSDHNHFENVVDLLARIAITSTTCHHRTTLFSLSLSHSLSGFKISHNLPFPILNSVCWEPELPPSNSWFLAAAEACQHHQETNQLGCRRSQSVSM